MRVELAQRFRAAAGLDDAVAQLTQRRKGAGPHLRVVLRHQHQRPDRLVSVSVRAGIVRLLLAEVALEIEAYRRAFARLRHDVHMAA
jgi:hypothetical protein